ncbi:CLUMA_CG012103, isoform A [Clunio marinus]|uniref:CLUMA_CG012103, isoform A n=1 Tax=Clunio marinus TaxID=568069 RepID=A0A1J1IFF5_9DIPT|nr:CLUMA_CG012103, isoform A [Clunio marinus]
MISSKKALGLLFDRPKEPIFKEKGDEGVIFEVPKSFVAERFNDVAFEVQNRFGDNTSPRVSVAQGGRMPNYDQFTKGLDRDAPFSLWVPRHSKIAGKLVELFMSQRSVDDLLSVAAYLRDRINPQLFNYALSVATLHRKDTKGIDIPTFVETFPDKFMDPRVIQQAREDATIVPQGSRRPIVIPTDYTASNLDPEHRLWYFREDVGINLHHWHWHLVYPFDGQRELVDKDRRGEIFYYMHQQVMARYNAERLSNNMAAVDRWTDFRGPIREGYFPKLDTLVANRSWPARPDGTTPSSLVRNADDLRLDIGELERARDRLLQAVNNGFANTSRNQRVPLDEVNGINILGNMVESSILSPNREFYGNLHNSMHNVVAYAHDPDHRHLENFGVIGDSTTAMRDPFFYRVHATIDDLFQAHKTRLTPYTAQQLTFPGITITGFQAQQTQGRANVLNTFWQQSDINMSRGLDFVPRGDVFARFTHLQHVPFTMTISVTNNSNAMRQGMVRIFMAPRNGFNGRPMAFNEQRLMMMETDKFIAQLRPGQNTINRRSTESAVTIPYEQTFRNLDINRPAVGSQREAEYNICGCGWPNHMLIPKGLPNGMLFDLFVMISNYEEDQVNQDLVGQCTDAAPYCGIRDRQYPDRKAMGYPFDRVARSGVNNLNNFLTPNMGTREISIVFNNRVTQRT